MHLDRQRCLTCLRLQRRDQPLVREQWRVNAPGQVAQGYQRLVCIGLDLSRKLDGATWVSVALRREKALRRPI